MCFNMGYQRSQCLMTTPDNYHESFVFEMDHQGLFVNSAQD